jgi:hypothetical protein
VLVHQAQAFALALRKQIGGALALLVVACGHQLENNDAISLTSTIAREI